MAQPPSSLSPTFVERLQSGEGPAIVVTVILVSLATIALAILIIHACRKKPVTRVTWGPNERLRERGMTILPTMTATPEVGHQCCSGGDDHPCGDACHCRGGEEDAASTDTADPEPQTPMGGCGRCSHGCHGKC